MPNANPVATAILFGLALALHPATARSQVAGAQRYVLLATDSLAADHLTVTDGDLMVLDGSFLSSRALVAPTSTIAAPLVRLDDEAACASVQASTSRGTNAACAEGQPFSRPYPSVAAACGFPDPFPACDPLLPIVVPHGATVALPPGAYGDVRVEGGAGGPGRLLLEGTYRFCSLRAAREAQVHFTGPSTLLVAGTFTGGNAVQIGPRPDAGPSAAQVDVLVAGRLVRLSRKASVGMRLCAPWAALRVGKGGTLTGRFAADAMRLRQTVVSLAVDGSVGTSTTSTTTTLPATVQCGDGVVGPGEVCDGDVPCSSPGGSFLRCPDCRHFDSGPCTPPTTTTTLPDGGTACGDGILTSGEGCDDGNRTDCDGCSEACTIEVVGNGIVDCDEECDDGNTRDCDGCDADGQRECGNGTIEAECGEVCDGDELGGQTCPGGVPTCASDCRSVDRDQCTPAVSPPQEICGNCIDDDGDGFVDFEDPSCCAGATVFSGALDAARIKPRRHGGALLRLRGRLGPRALSLAAGRDDVVLQLRMDGGPELLCARIPAGKFRVRRAALRFQDRHRRVSSAQSLDLVRLRRTPRGVLRAAIRGRSMGFAIPDPGMLRVTVGFTDPARGPASNRCAALAAPVQAARRGGVRSR